MDEIMVKFLRDGVKPAERMIGNLIEMEVILSCHKLSNVSLALKLAWEVDI